MSGKKLTPKEETFCLKYFEHGNGRQAVKDAGYNQTDNAAATTSTRLLKKANVQARLKELRTAQTQRVEVTSDMVILELKKIAFANMADIAEWNASGVTFKDSNSLKREISASIAEVSESTNQHGGSLKIKQHDKIRALELLGKHLGMFVEQVKFPQIDDVEWIE